MHKILRFFMKHLVEGEQWFFHTFCLFSFVIEKWTSSAKGKIKRPLSSFSSLPDHLLSILLAFLQPVAFIFSVFNVRLFRLLPVITFRCTNPFYRIKQSEPFKTGSLAQLPVVRLTSAQTTPFTFHSLTPKNTNYSYFSGKTVPTIILW